MPANNPNRPSPIETLTDPNSPEDPSKEVTALQEGVDGEILKSLQQSRQHKEILFCSTLTASLALYALAAFFAARSKQSGLSYFLEIAAFMTPATIILVVLLTKTMTTNSKSNKEDNTSAIVSLGKLAQEILKGLTKS